MTLDVTPQDRGLSRALAWINYGLLFAAVFFAGVPALIAVVIAYAQRRDAPPQLRGHYDFQIRIFWTAFALAAAAAACLAAVLAGGLAALWDYSGLEAAWSHLAWNLDVTSFWEGGAPFVLAMSVATVVFSGLAVFWMLAAAIVGAIRLASAPGIGHSPAP